MPRKNHNADYHRPKESYLSLLPYQGRIELRRSGLKITGESIVREHRNLNDVIPAEAGIQKRSSILERIIKTFFWVTVGWMIGYLHHFLIIH